MIARPFAEIAGLGVAVPERVVTNADFEATLDTSDQWIVERTGIRERRIGAPGETTSMMGAEAVRRLMAGRGLQSGDIDAIIVAAASSFAVLANQPGSSR